MKNIKYCVGENQNPARRVSLVLKKDRLTLMRLLNQNDYEFWFELQILVRTTKVLG